jgi:succinate dehydrogenase/fumarate reductase cytochrome b subunit
MRYAGRNRIRHPRPGAGYGYDLRIAYIGSWLVILGAIVLTVLTWMLAYAAGGG